MKAVKHLFVITLALLFITSLFYYRIDYIVLLTALGILLLYSVIFYKESLTKIKSLNNLELAKGMTFVVAFLPIVYSLRINIHLNNNRAAIFVFWIAFIVATFNFGIKAKEKEIEKK